MPNLLTGASMAAIQTGLAWLCNRRILGQNRVLAFGAIHSMHRDASMSRAVLGAVAVVLSVSGAFAVDDILFERDTPYVPTPPDVVERMLDMAQIRPGEFLIDLGSGDGRIAIAAAQRGARAYG